MYLIKKTYISLITTNLIRNTSRYYKHLARSPCKVVLKIQAAIKCFVKLYY